MLSKKEPTKHKHIPYTELFAKWDKTLFLILFAVIYIWCFFILPVEVIEWIALKIGVTEKTTGWHLIILLYSAGGITLLITLGRFLIGEPLVSGNSKESVFYTDQFPSKKISMNFKIDSGLATQYFLAYYDCWHFNSTSQHDLYLHTTYVRYWCLFVFLAKRLLLVLSLLSLIMIMITFGRFHYQKIIIWQTIAGQLVAFFIMIGLFIFIIKYHKLPNSVSNMPATGCWEAWSKSCDANFREFEIARGNLNLEEFYKLCRKLNQNLRDNAYPSRVFKD